jgi:uncharacterized phage infection (PIP) family protein YhgE
VTPPPSWREDVYGAPSRPDGRLSADSVRRIGNALIAYGIAGLALAAIGLVVVLVAGLRLSDVADRLQANASQAIVVLDRTANVLDDAATTVEDVASTLDSADPMIQRVADSITTTVTNLRGLQSAAAAVSILGAEPLGGLAQRFGQVADALDGIDTDLATFGDELSSDAAALRRNVASLQALATELHTLHDELGEGLIDDAFGAIRLMFYAIVAFLVAVAALPAVAALFIGSRIRREVGPAPAAA